MEILIGKQGNQPFPLSEPSISRQHAIFRRNETTGMMTLTDNNSTNGTWILQNGVFRRLYGQARVTPETVVRLGAKYIFRIKDLLAKPQPARAKVIKKEEPPVDISKLKRVYDVYTQRKMELDGQNSSIMMWRIASMSLGSVLGIIIGLFIPSEYMSTTMNGIIRAVCVILGLGIGWIIVDFKSKSLLRSKNANEQFFKKNYCCPKCGYHFGSRIYENLLAEGHCPNPSCRAKFVAKMLLMFFLSFCGLQSWAQKTYVVAVGISNYQYPQIAPDLPCSTGDARAVSHFFHDYNGSHVFMLLNENATRGHILQVLKREFSKSTYNDEIIFVFSGHGLQGGLSTYRTNIVNNNLVSIVTYDEVQDIMKACKARRKVILAMACYSGGLTLPRNEGKRPQRRSTHKTSVMLFTSSRPSEVSWESPAMTCSFFFTRILEAFRGLADSNGDRKVTAREMFNYVYAKVISDTQGQQHPQLWGQFDDSMVVVYVK